MLVIEDILIGDAVVQHHFVCNLSACKGACCIEGEGGAPLEPEEREILAQIYPEVKPYMTEEGQQLVETQGFYTGQRKGNYKTPLMKNGACAYLRNDNGMWNCGIQKAFQDGKITFPKPVSCHLYPIRVTKSRIGTVNVNYEEWDICAAGCTLGKSLQVPLYQFVKDALIRKFGAEFYEALDLAAKRL